MNKAQTHMDLKAEADGLHRPASTVDAASVRVMQSYDYCHFEVTLGSDQPLTLDAVDALRKGAARLCDKAIAQYKIKKASLCFQQQGPWKIAQIEPEAMQIAAIAEKDRSPEQQATLKRYQDLQYALKRAIEYDYQDDYTVDPDEAADPDDDIDLLHPDL